MNTEQMHKTLLQGEINQREFFIQFGLLLETKVYLEGIVIDGDTNQFENLRKYIASPVGLGQTVPVIAALLLPKPEVRAMFMAILAEELNIESEQSDVSLRQLNRKYKSSSDETKAQKDLLNHPNIHAAAMGGVALTNAQKNKMRKSDQEPREPMATIRYQKGNIESAFEALAKKHSKEDFLSVQSYIDKLYP